jgi:hypothetical protein
MGLAPSMPVQNIATIRLECGSKQRKNVYEDLIFKREVAG